MVLSQPSKLRTGVRFPSPAPNFLERSHFIKQTKEQRDAIIAEAVTTAKEHTAELNSGPMKHTLQRRAALEKKQSKRR
jgi:hypothetical protein